MSCSQNKDREETYWPVGVTLDEIICVICKGIQKYPIFPKPILFNFPLQVPVLQLDTSNGALEEK
jgi:chromosome transmission fidelity protein 4